MTNLTELWKKGELKDGYYYVKDVTYILPANLGKYDNQFYFSGNEVGYGYEENTELEVLAEVPDYVEWRNMVNCACEEHEANKCFIEENAKLKELLKEVNDYLPEFEIPMSILAKIDEALK